MIIVIIVVIGYLESYMYVVKSLKFCCSWTFFPKTFSGKISIAYLRYKNSNSNRKMILILIVVIVVMNSNNSSSNSSHE